MPRLAFQSNKEAKADPETRSQILTSCPVTGVQAKKLTENRIVIPNGQANWWHCSACQGWHINLAPTHSHPPEIDQ